MAAAPLLAASLFVAELFRRKLNVHGWDVVFRGMRA